MYGTVIIFEKKSEKSDILAKKSEHNWERAEQKKRACWNRKKNSD